MRFKDKKTGAIYTITTDSVISMFKNDRYEEISDTAKTEVEETKEEEKEVKKSKK